MCSVAYTVSSNQEYAWFTGQQSTKAAHACLLACEHTRTFDKRTKVLTTSFHPVARVGRRTSPLPIGFLSQWVMAFRGRKTDVKNISLHPLASATVMGRCSSLRTVRMSPCWTNCDTHALTLNGTFTPQPTVVYNCNMLTAAKSLGLDQKIKSERLHTETKDDGR